MKYLSIIILFSIFLISACSSKPAVETQVMQLNVPEQHIPDCPDVVYSGNSIEDKLDFIPVIVDEYQDCQNQIEGLIEWNENVIQDRED